MISSKVTNKFQVTIPSKIRKILKLKAGDRLVFHVRADESIEIRKGTEDYLKMVEQTLSEWESFPEDFSV